VSMSFWKSDRARRGGRPITVPLACELTVPRGASGGVLSPGLISFGTSSSPPRPGNSELAAAVVRECRPTISTHSASDEEWSLATLCGPSDRSRCQRRCTQWRGQARLLFVSRTPCANDIRQLTHLQGHGRHQFCPLSRLKFQDPAQLRLQSQHCLGQGLGPKRHRRTSDRGATRPASLRSPRHRQARNSCMSPGLVGAITRNRPLSLPGRLLGPRRLCKGSTHRPGSAGR
jgi:hypothetical protein